MQPRWIDGGPKRSLRSRLARMTVLATLPVLAVGGVAALATVDYSGSTTPKLTVGEQGSVVFTGRGNGHSRGMGQWGAFAYAKAGWKAEQILAYYYGGTTLSITDTNQTINVQLSKQSRVAVFSPAGATVNGQRTPAGAAVTLAGANATITQGCGGPVLSTVPATQVDPAAAGSNRPADELLRFCGSNTTYRGGFTVKDGKVINVVNIEDYLRGVVPTEMSPGWGDQGGYEALRAQAVAARSYALADKAANRNFNDTQSSQVYGGVGKEDARTDKAIASTAGWVVMKDGKIARTEFSASTGGFTAGGDFPAVADPGDALSPYKSWQKIVPSAEIAQKFGVGQFQSLKVTDVGDTSRAVTVTITGSTKTVTATGAELRSALGLQSDVFSVGDPAAVAVQSQNPVQATQVAQPAQPGQTAVPTVAVPAATATATPAVAGAEQTITAQNAIATLYQKNGGPGGRLGNPVGATMNVPGQGIVQRYQNGTIFWTQAGGAELLDTATAPGAVMNALANLWGGVTTGGN